MKNFEETIAYSFVLGKKIKELDKKALEMIEEDSDDYEPLKKILNELKLLKEEIKIILNSYDKNSEVDLIADNITDYLKHKAIDIPDGTCFKTKDFGGKYWFKTKNFFYNKNMFCYDVECIIITFNSEDGYSIRRDSCLLNDLIEQAVKIEQEEFDSVFNDAVEYLKE